MTFTDKPLPFSIDDILKYEKSKSTIYSSIIPHTYQLSGLVPTNYHLSFSPTQKHSCSGKTKVLSSPGKRKVTFFLKIIDQHHYIIVIYQHYH